MSGQKKDQDEWIGRTLKGRYLVERELGAGGMAIVYLCTDQDLGRKVVVKAPRKALAAESEFRIRFEREIKSQLGMEHPHICTVIDAETTGDMPYCVLQYLSGGDLSDRLKATKTPMSMKEILGWLPQVAKALDFIHSKGWVHRDVKPGNTMFDEYGNAFVGDFGIARAAEAGDMELTQTGAIVGSPQYMAPDLMLGHELGPSYDQYALGCMVYAALSKRIPHQATTPMAILHLRAIKPIPPLGGLVRGVPAGIEAAVMRSLDRDPKKRFGSCEELADAIRDGNVATAAAAGGVADEPTIIMTKEELTPVSADVDSASGGVSSAPTSVGPPAGAISEATGAGAKTMARPMAPPKKGGGLKIAAAALVVLLAGAAFAAWQYYQGISPPALADLQARPGGPIPSLVGRVDVLLSQPDSQIEGMVTGRDLKTVQGAIRRHRDPYYSDLAEPTINCQLSGARDFSCSLDAEPGRYEVELSLNNGIKSSTQTLDVRVGKSGLVPLPPNANGREVYERVADGARTVRIPGAGTREDFLIDEHEVSWGQYFRYLQAERRHEAPVPDWAGVDSPVVNVDWEGANAYCEWAAARLPTGTEWKRAAEGDAKAVFPWGDEFGTAKANTADPDGEKYASPVHAFEAGASEYGILNMVGNVAEWVSDQSRRPGRRVLYGGSFKDRGAQLSATHAESALPTAAAIHHGLRCAMDIPG